MTPLPLPFKVGVPGIGGPMITAGGVAFLGGTLDYYVRAYDVTTGNQLWRDRLPAGGQATPMTYHGATDGNIWWSSLAVTARRTPSRRFDHCLCAAEVGHRPAIGEQSRVSAQASMPRAASTVRMRATARLGSRSRPAASASRNSSARCWVERALSWPPTMVKWL